MGKGFNNYMTKKFFHPGSKDNIKRVWMAQQKTNYEKQKQDDLLSQYQKEQEMYKNRALLGDEKAKLGLSFMYDAPPGLKKKEVEEKEEEVKFEWQRKYNAPRENYAKDDETIRDQPFGIEVRNVRCIKCRKWGHVNTDRICPLFNQDLTAEPPQPSTSASSLLEGLQNDGFTLKKSILGKMADNTDTEKLLENEDELDPEVQFLKSLNQKQRKKLLKKLNKLKSREKKKKKKHKKKSDSSAEEEEQESPDPFRESESRRAHDHKDHRKDDRHQKRQRRSSSPANSPSPGRGHRTKRGESPRSLSRDHGSNFKERQRSRRSDSFERSKYRDSRGGNIDRNRSRSPIDRDRRSLNVDKEKQRRMRRSRSSSSDSDAAMQRRPQRQRSRSAERGQRSNRRSDSLERHTHTSRKRRSNSRDRRSRSRDRRSRSRDGRRRRSDS